METSARYLLVGLLLLAAIAAGFGFVYWLNTYGGFAQRETYSIRFDGSVAGLILGSPVQFNGIRVGEVTALDLNPEAPGEVLVTISVDSRTPVRADTAVSLTYAGLTGVPEVALSGGSAEAPRPAARDGAPALLQAAPGSNVNWTDSARAAFGEIETLLTENAEAVRSTMDNLDTFSSALARNADRFDDIIDGLARLAGARPGGRDQVVYTLSAARDLELAGPLPETQIIVSEPTIRESFNSPQFMARTDGGSRLAFEGAAWSDTVPKVVQDALLRSFENAGYGRVGRDFQGLAEEVILLVDIAVFELVPGPRPAAEIVLSTRLTAGGEILAMRRFEHAAPMAGEDAAAAAAALSEAFTGVARELVPWAVDEALRLAALDEPLGETAPAGEEAPPGFD